MAKASGKNSKTTAKKTTSPAKKAPSTKSAVRNTAVPRKTASPAAASKRQPTHDEIARRAYEIYASGTGGSEHENWHRAERELRGA
jgi:hypothetical protein